MQQTAPYAAMLNILGWGDQTPEWEKVLALPNTHLHLYGKQQAPKGRKMGHVSVVAETRTMLEQTLAEASAIVL
jgi:5-(carboxyamino)imidazole ribonucleotide synthase